MGILQKFLFGSIAVWTPVVPIVYFFRPRGSSNSDSIQVTIEPVTLSSDLGLAIATPWKGVVKPKDCWSLAQDTENWKELKELIVCRDKNKPQKLNVYFYKSTEQDIASNPQKTKSQIAKKVTSLSYKEEKLQGSQTYQYLEVSLANNQKERMNLSFVTAWVNAQNLNPYEECKLVEKAKNQPSMTCETKRDGQIFSVSFSLS